MKKTMSVREFSKKYNIKTNEWVYKQDIVTSLRIDDVFLKNLKI